MGKPIVFTRKASGMVRELGVTDVAIFLMAIVFGAGILLFTPAGAVSFPGASIPLAYLVVGLVMLPFIITIGLMLTALPRTGGLYVLIARTLHPTVGYLGGWMFYVAMGLIAGLVCYVTSIVGSAGFARIGAELSPGVILWSSLAVVFIFWLINLGGIRLVKNVTRVIVVLPFAVLFIMLIYMMILGPEGGMATYDAIYGEGAMEKIIQTAGEKGWEFPAFSWSMTISAFLAVVFAYGGAEGIAALGGEMRARFSTIFWGLVGGFLIIILLYLGTSYSCFAAFGKGVTAYTFLAQKHPDALAAIVPSVGPSVPYFMLSVIKADWLAFLVAITIMLWPLNGALMLFTATNRLMFAFSFDRAVPGIFSKVNRRGAPTYASFLSMIIAFGGVVIFFYRAHVGAALGTLDMLLFQIYWLFGLSAMVIPFVRPDIAERLPGGSTLISILGFYTFLMGWFFVGIAAKELNVTVIFILVFILFVGFFFYLIQQAINKKKKVNISEIYRQIPPE